MNENANMNAAISEAAAFLKRPRFDGIKRLYTARQIAEQQGTLFNDYSVAKSAAHNFFKRLRELYAEKKSITTYGPYSPSQAVMMKRAGIEGIYLGGWATSAKGSTDEDPGADLASYPLSQVPNEAASIVRALLMADKNQTFSRFKMSDEERSQKKAFDFSPYIIADADLANTQGLSNVDRAKLTAIFFDYARVGGPVIFDMSLHGIDRTRNIVRLILEPPFLAATICALLGAILLAFKASVRFGPARAMDRPYEAGKAALADNTAALIRMAKREKAYGARYAEMMRRRIAEAIGAPKKMPPASLDALIDKIASDKGSPTFSTLAKEIGDAEDVSAFLRAARKIYRFKKEIARDHR